MIASGVVYTSFQNLAISIPQERDDGTLKRLQGTPMPKASYFIGKVGLVLVIYVVQVAAADGDRRDAVRRAPAGRGRRLVDVHLGQRARAGLLHAARHRVLGSVSRSGRGAPALVSPVVLVLQFTSGVFFQYDELPPWMQQMAALFPLKWLCQGMRSVFLPDTFQSVELAGAWELERVALVLVVWSVLALLLALRFFSWSRRGED